MNPETTAFLEQLAELPSVPPGDVDAVRQRRRWLAARFDSGPAGVNSTDVQVGGVRVRRFLPVTVTRGVAVVYAHGGGWVACDLDTHDGVCRRIASGSGLEVISVDYRRAPEHRHPAAVDDVLAVVIFLGDDRILLAGDSSGAHIAVEAALELRAASVVDALLLIQPADGPGETSESWRSYGTGYFLTTAAMRWYWNTYLPENSTLAPLSERDLAGTPRSYVLTTSLDPSQDDGSRLAKALRAAGSHVLHEHLIGLPHGCFTLPRAFPSVQSALERAAAWVATDEARPLVRTSASSESRKATPS